MEQANPSGETYEYDYNLQSDDTDPIQQLCKRLLIFF